MSPAAQLAAAHPDAKLPCPVCANTLAARNVTSHLAKVHASAGPLDAWRGRRFALFPASLQHEGSSITLKTLLGRRTVRLPCPVQVGSRIGTQTDPIMSSYGDTTNLGSTTVKIGWYLRLGDAITIGCRTAGNVKAHWIGWEQGPRRRIVDLVVDRRVLVELEYVLAASGALRPA